MALLIVAYQRTLGPLLNSHFGSSCRFAPSCSHYAVEALRGNGLVIGGVQTVWRLLRCGPWTKGGIDHPRIIGTLSSRLSNREVTRAR